MYFERMGHLDFIRHKDPKEDQTTHQDIGLETGIGLAQCPQRLCLDCCSGRRTHLQQPCATGTNTLGHNTEFKIRLHTNEPVCFSSTDLPNTSQTCSNHLPKTPQSFPSNFQTTVHWRAGCRYDEGPTPATRAIWATTKKWCPFSLPGKPVPSACPDCLPMMKGYSQWPQASPTTLRSDSHGLA